MNNRFKFFILKRFLLVCVIILSLSACTADNEDSKGNESESERRGSDSDTSSRAISPQKEYTKDKPAEWESIAEDHLPEITYDSGKSKNNITVKVLGKKFTERHYIEVIGIMDERSADLDVKYFKRNDSPLATLTLNSKEYDPEKVKVFAKCNLHDLWTVPLISTPE